MSRPSLNQQRSSETLNVPGDPNNLFNNTNQQQQNFFNTSYFPNTDPTLNLSPNSHLQAQFPSPSLDPALHPQSVFTQSQQQTGLLGTSFDMNTANQNFGDFSLYGDGQSPTHIDANGYIQQSQDVLNPQDLLTVNHSPHLMPQANQPVDWTSMSFHQVRHHRALSDQSDISPHPSPFLGNRDSFQDHPSPLLSPEQPGEMTAFLQSNDNFGLDQFSLNDPVNGISPHHSPRISPHLTPQHTGNSSHRNSLQGNPYLMSQMNQFHFPQQVNHVPNTATLQGLGLQPALNSNGMLPPGEVVITPPSIEVDFAPPQRQPTFPKKLADESALSPPSGGRMNRQRSKSDPPLLMISRPATPDLATSVASTEDRNSLHPSDFLGSSLRAPSPTPSLSSVSSVGSHSSKHVRRSSTSAIPNRDYILDLAAPQRPGANPSDTKRVQKHPATFQCHLCPKRFTRAYNLRSHLRTHTDERPFVCTVCGKAFARQHDRKRHEGLHSGEKKFVCKGDLKSGGTWGCGRRFARADALGRHFRSEAGRVCIKPLLDEEASERMRQQAENNMQANMGFDPNAPFPATLDQLPLALIAQYPALASAWDTLANMPAGAYDDDDDDGKRGSFDASSGGEWDEVSSTGLGSHRNSYDGSGFSREDWSGSDAGWHSDAGGDPAYPTTPNMWMKQEKTVDWNLPG